MSVLTDFLREYWPHLAALLSLAFSLVVAAQAAMQKNDVRAAIAWVGVILMSPFVGAFLYLVAGINRIRHDQMSTQRSRLIKDYVNSAHPTFGDVGPVSAPQFASLRVLCDQVSRFPLQDGNHITLLDSGDQAYPAMLQAIDEAHHCIALQSYIFDHDRIGLRFVDALRRAQERGVEIRVLIDAVGARYSHPPILRLLERKGIRADRFMTNPLGLRSAYANLRSHRKILFVDGHLGFMGGMNIRESFMASLAGRRVLCDQVSRFPLQDGNHITLLDSGDQAYPAMLQAIDEAHHCIALQSYIFDHDRIGLRFVDALRRAQERGVEIRVLIDAVGARYSHPPILRLLERKGIRADRFMTNPLGLRSAYANLRSHRKILFVDGHLGFMGGMNIRESFMASLAGRRADSDTHFRVEGPLATQLFAVFANDWEFATGERLRIEDWVRVSPLPPAPRVPARCIRTGPDRFMAATHRVLLGALAVAQRHVRIQSPYFLPDQILIGALNTAARRGIQVDIVIPGRNNLRLVNYAMTAQLAQVLEGGCRVWRCRKNFDHSKLLTIDGAWSYVGSSNLDPRSLRLNFELDMEVYDRALAERLARRIDADIEQSERVTLESLNAMPYLKRLRNRIIWLASPYL